MYVCVFWKTGELWLDILLLIVPACTIYSTTLYKLFGNWFVVVVIAHSMATLIAVSAFPELKKAVCAYMYIQNVFVLII